MEKERGASLELQEIVNAELHADTWDHIPELSLPDITGALGRFEVALHQFDRVAKEKGKKSAWNLFHGAMQDYIVASGLNAKDRVKERIQIETLFLVSRMIQNEMQYREASKQSKGDFYSDSRVKKASGQEAIAQAMHLANWQNRLAIFILSQKNLPELQSTLEKFWSLAAQLQQKAGIESEFINRRERGISRVISTSELFRNLGYHVLIPTAMQDVHQKVDLWAIKPQEGDSADSVIVGGIQIKPQKEHAKGIVLDVVDYEQGQLQEDKRDEVWNITASLKVLKAKMLKNTPLTQIKPLAIFAQVPTSRELPHDISTSTGILTLEAIEKFQKNIDEKTKNMLNIV